MMGAAKAWSAVSFDLLGNAAIARVLDVERFSQTYHFFCEFGFG